MLVSSSFCRLLVASIYRNTTLLQNECYVSQFMQGRTLRQKQRKPSFDDNAKMQLGGTGMFLASIFDLKDLFGIAGTCFFFNSMQTIRLFSRQPRMHEEPWIEATIAI
jgi:hypothetical protein